VKQNVLVISASPRRGGNSDTLCGQFMRGAKESGHQVEKIFLKDKKINYCMACEGCQRNGGTCIQKDDMAEVLDKMMAANVIVMATPVYYYSMNAQMKTLIDRTLPKYGKMSNKDMYFIVTSNNPEKESLKPVIDGFRGFMSCYEGMREKGIIYGAGAGKKGDVKGHPAMEQAYEMGKSV
jgi:multimeric flavodoxin WrbA